MDNCTIKSTVDLKRYLIENLNYSTLSNMDFEEYKEFVIYLFTILDQLRKKGLIEKKDLDSFIQNHYSDVMSTADESDVLFERRFSGITEELVEFCSSPFFWNTSFDVYILKWHRAFEIYWYKKIDSDS